MVTAVDVKESILWVWYAGDGGGRGVRNDDKFPQQ